jgi:hypothetical protein
LRFEDRGEPHAEYHLAWYRFFSWEQFKSGDRWSFWLIFQEVKGSMQRS